MSFITQAIHSALRPTPRVTNCLSAWVTSTAETEIIVSRARSSADTASALPTETMFRIRPDRHKHNVSEEKPKYPWEHHRLNKLQHAWSCRVTFWGWLQRHGNRRAVYRHADLQRRQIAHCLHSRAIQMHWKSSYVDLNAIGRLFLTPFHRSKCQEKGWVSNDIKLYFFRLISMHIDIYYLKICLR